MNMDGGDTMEKILNLTLEIVYLLTGEDYMVVKKKASRVGLETLSRTSTLESPPYARNKDEKILDLTNKIMELLTGEVPIRYEDITVSFSMEEWEYVEGHKDLYKDMITEDQERSMSLNGSLSGSRSASTHLDHEPSRSGLETSGEQDLSMNCAVGPTMSCEIGYVSTDLRPSIKEEPSSWAKGSVTFTDDTPLLHHIKEEFLSHGQEDAMGDDIYTPNYYNQYTSITEEPISCQGGSLSVLYAPIENAQQYSHTIIMDESASQVEGKPTFDNVQYTQAHSKAQLRTYGKRSLVDTNLHKPQDNTQYKWDQDKPRPVYYEKGHITSVVTTTHHGKMISGSTTVGSVIGDVSMPIVVQATEKPKLISRATTEDSGKGVISMSIGFPSMAKPKLISRATTEDSGKGVISMSIGFPSMAKPKLISRATTEDSGKGVISMSIGFPSMAKPKLISRATTEDSGKGVISMSIGFPSMAKPKLISSSQPVDADIGVFSMPVTARAMEKPFHCLECGKSFTQSANLIRHQKIHKGEKLFTCLECGKCFSRNANLITHQRIHTGEKPFTCPDCSKCFKQYSTLVVHRRIHTGEKPFSCLECNKCFTHRTSLVLHQRIHKGEKPYSCSECGKCFVSRSQLKNHLRIPTGEKTIALHGCTLKSLRMSDMNIQPII